MTRFVVLREALDHAELTEPSLLADALPELREKLGKLYVALMNSEYPCPVCVAHHVPHGERGTVTLEWDHECDDMGYKVSSWPVFVSTCQDPPREPYTRRGTIRRAGSHYVSSVEFPRNHGELMNSLIEDGNSDTYCDYVLGSAQERRRLRELLGISEPDHSWR